MGKGIHPHQNKNLQKTKNVVKTANESVKKINCVTTAKILGHIINTNESMDEAIKDRLKKAKNAWYAIKNKYITNKEINTKLRLQLFDSLIGSILLYSLHIIQLNKTNINKIQSFYSKCVRAISEGYYHENTININNKTIRAKHNIPTLESKLYYYRMNMLYRLKKHNR